MTKLPLTVPADQSIALSIEGNGVAAGPFDHGSYALFHVDDGPTVTLRKISPSLNRLEPVPGYEIAPGGVVCEGSVIFVRLVRIRH